MNSIPIQLTRIYHMRHRNGLTKIGHSKTPHAREKTLQGEDPFLRIIWVSSQVTLAAEDWWHARFASKRVRGEWFDVTDDELLTAIDEFPVSDFGADSAHHNLPIPDHLRIRAENRFIGNRSGGLTLVQSPKSPYWLSNIHVGYRPDGNRRYSPRSTRVRVIPPPGSPHSAADHKRFAMTVAEALQRIADAAMSYASEGVSRGSFDKWANQLESEIQSFRDAVEI